VPFTWSDTFIRAIPVEIQGVENGNPKSNVTESEPSVSPGVVKGKVKLTSRVSPGAGVGHKQAAPPNRDPTTNNATRPDTNVINLNPRQQCTCKPAIFSHLTAIN
jgi:hypothetical protein